jgi:iron-sulfur cluster repair protein YtfE (RIC family)
MTANGPQDGARSTGLLTQLRWVHDMLRRDLATVRQLAARVADGASPQEVEVGLRTLQSQGPLFQLRVDCLSYCQILHSHHWHEDLMLFPAVRRLAPQLSDTVDQLEADHRVVSTLLDTITELAQDLVREETRRALVDALTNLSAHLLQHLEFEEESLGPLLASWHEWPEQPPADPGRPGWQR